MNIKIFKASFLIAALSVFLTGCSTSGVSQSDYDKRIITMEMGMSKKEFSQLFPEVKPRGAKKYRGGTVEVLELLVDEYSFIPSGHKKRNPLTGMESTVTWFYFYNNKLIQYGQPQDWPAEPDTIIEVR